MIITEIANKVEVNHMRVRKNNKAIPSLLAHPAVLDVADIEHKDWRTLLSNPNQPLYVELGTGKGRFITTAAKRWPHINWIGVERIPEPLYQAVKKGMPEETNNLLYFWADIKYLDQFFHVNEVDRFYLHFSDPWPKKRHQKRRLTHRQFLSKYKQLLKPNGELIIKTDSPSLFTFSCEELTETGWQITGSSQNLHQSPYAKENIQTEYEEKFTSRGMPIYYIQAVAA